ncbi:MAG: LptA/OstA family protein [Oscillatoria sp. PMC 1051.18]|nr:LptA/OstA family protein [Oscillatoria sp. PMC 1050.18]MEC5031460.1 LptA/OstA family protein [Oscillatoria sp. PMC 1051.18]
MLSFEFPAHLKRRLGMAVVVPAMIAGAIATFPQLKVAQAQTAADGRALSVRSDIQEANSETGVITARGNVQVNYPARQIQATAAQAQYFSRERMLVLTGNVYVLQAGNSMRAETITYLVDEGRFVATPKDNRQVESIYIVTDPEASTSPTVTSSPR